MDKADKVNLGSELRTGIPIDYTSEFGNNYKGTFIFKRPSMRDYMRMGGIKSEMLRQAGVVDPKLVDGMIVYLSHVMSTLSVVTLKAPSWVIDDKGKIDFEILEEVDVIYHIFAKYEEWENSFRKPNGREGEKEVGDRTSENSGATE